MCIHQNSLDILANLRPRQRSVPYKWYKGPSSEMPWTKGNTIVTTTAAHKFMILFSKMGWLPARWYLYSSERYAHTSSSDLLIKDRSHGYSNSISKTITTHIPVSLGLSWQLYIFQYDAPPALVCRLSCLFHRNSDVKHTFLRWSKHVHVVVNIAESLCK